MSVAVRFRAAHTKEIFMYIGGGAALLIIIILLIILL